MILPNSPYDPTTGRFTTPDPIGLAGGLNRYVYVEGNPLSYIDPDGKNPLLIIIAPAVVGAFTNGITSYLTTGSARQAKEAFITGGIAGAFAGATALGAILGGAPGLATGILAAGVDLGINIANAPGGLPDGGIKDFSNGINRIFNPKDPNKPMCQ